MAARGKQHGILRVAQVRRRNLKDYRQLAHEVLNWKQGQVAKVLATGAWIEITAPMEKDDDQEIEK